jgi:hypothetical protein
MAALLAMSIPATLASPVSCSGYLANPSDIAQCADYLTSIGTQACETYGGIATQFCQRGEAEVVGVGTGAVGVKTSSPWWVFMPFDPVRPIFVDSSTSFCFFSWSVSCLFFWL